MSAKTIVVGVLALVFGLACAIGVKAFLDAQALKKPKVVLEKPKSVSVVVAKKLISHGKTITPEDVQVQDWPENMVTAGSLRSPEEVVNHAALVTMYKGDVVTRAKLATGPIHDLSSHLGPDMRAFTIHIPTVGSGVAGFILPGNKVDVLLTVTDLPSLRESGAMTVTILQRVEILAVDQETEIPESNKMDMSKMHSVTLAVTAFQAAKLALAGSKGTLNLALRNPEDKQEETISPVTLSDLQFLKDQQPGTEAKTEAVQSSVSLATHLTAGMRAFTIKATLTSGVAGLVLPKDRVDVLLTTADRHAATEESEAATVVLLQDIEVLAVDQLLEAPAANKTEPKQQYVVTLAVTTVQAATLALGETRGILSLLLRNPGDPKESEAATRVTVADLKLPQTHVSKAETRPGPATVPQQQLYIRTLRGSQNGITTVFPMYEADRHVGATKP